ncbi:MAG: M48 family metallopeptidase, partial [Gammaproteobacteria bacterium]|nr:M48 family metallopeptidase [Gammaproteobacteria bacterium]
RLKLTDHDCREVTLCQEQFVLGVDTKLQDAKRENFVRKKLIQWYRTNAELQLKDKVEHYAKIIGVKPRSVTVKVYKARWGSCSIEGEIAFNWKLIVAPHRIVDYVVVHELCHMHQHNHSSRFWACVEQVLPDYRERRQWLKDNQRYLDI